MTEEQFRTIALGLPGAAERAHMGHPDFRVGDRVFATLYCDDDGEDWGMVVLTPAQQRASVRAHPEVFSPVKGGWGKRGCTRVRLPGAGIAVVKAALRLAWMNRTEPKATRKSAGRAKRPR